MAEATQVRVLVEKIDGGGFVLTAFDEVGKVCSVECPNKRIGLEELRDRVHDRLDGELKFSVEDLHDNPSSSGVQR